MGKLRNQNLIIGCFVCVIGMTIVIDITPSTVAQVPSPAGGNWFEFDGIDDFAKCKNCVLPSVESIFMDGFTLETWINIQDFPSAIPDTFNETIIIDAGGCQLSLYTTQLDKPSNWVKGIMFKVPTTEIETVGGIVFDGFVDAETIGLYYTLYSKISKWNFATTIGGIIDWTVPDVGKWVHVMGIIDNGNKFALCKDPNNKDVLRVSLFINGRAISSYFCKKFMDNLNTDVTIGGNTRSFNGFIDEVRISSIARYNVANFAIPNAPFEVDEKTIGLWHFDDPAGSTLFNDASGGNHTLYDVRPAGKMSVTWGHLKTD